MQLRLLSFVLAAMFASPLDPTGFAEITRVANDLVGPVRSVTIKKLGYSATETYDHTGHLIEAVIDIAQAHTATYSLFRYDQDGRLREELTLDSNGRLMFRKQVVYARNSEGLDTAAVTTSDNGGFQSAEFSLYDQWGHLREQLWVNQSIAYKSLFDVLGRRIYSARYSKGELFSELKHQYDTHGRVRELVIYSAQGVMDGRVRIDYDEIGRRMNATTETFGEHQQRTWITSYEYDAMGNWIKELTVEQASSSQNATAFVVPIVQERIIQYYTPTENKAP